MKTPLRSLVVLALWLAMAGGAGAQVVTATLSATFTNPLPVASRLFGYALAADADRIMVGAYNNGSPMGAAYLYNLNGALVTTFTNPGASTGGKEGSSVAFVGSDKVLLGIVASSGQGAAYLFGTNGTRLINFTNSSHTSFFGHSVAALGPDRVLIGADTAGLAHLFGTNGVLLTTFTSPASPNNGFGFAVRAFGADKVLIGSYAGAFLMDTNGQLITAFTNPAAYPFGVAVASLGADKVLIGSYSHGAYIYATNGTLLTAFTNPFPPVNAEFGSSLAAVGFDKILVGAAQSDVGGTGSGAAFLFSTNGTHLTTFTNPSPAFGDQFGNAIAVLGTDKMLLGADYDTVGGVYAGAVYLFTLSAPPLNVERLAGGNVRFFWPLPATGLVLEQTTALTPPPSTNIWSQVPFPYQTNATEISVTVTPAGNQFYRLRQP